MCTCIQRRQSYETDGSRGGGCWEGNGGSLPSVGPFKCGNSHGNAYQSAVCPPETKAAPTPHPPPPRAKLNSPLVGREMKLKAENEF